MSSYHSIEDLLNDPSFRAWVLEQAKVERWDKILDQQGDQREKLLQAKEILLALNNEGQDWSSRKQEKLFEKIQFRTKQRQTGKPKGKVKLGLFFLLAIALFAGTIWWSHFAGLISPKSTITYVEEAIWVAKANPKGQKSRIHLPDGSTAFLNAESSIRFRQNFGKSGREIYLQGEAFFEVAEDKEIPFEVYCDALSITALGTSFNINSFREGITLVQLATGKVMVENNKDQEAPLELNPGEEVVHIYGNGMEKRSFDIQNAFLWKSGTLLFENTDLDTFVEDLERWYGVEIKIVNPPRDQLQITGKFTEDYLSKVLEAIGYAYGFSYRINQKQVVLTFD
ncbi:FecR family protein [Pleomorphovibrio marinus]|uniref:FecR family protein n=1 Tax=Pleomorphovibrio marinus TaxID=2164132 RepID=UPI000E0C0E2A|nr:FecR domain-containing protein [Pleomorphovibrio marinus]